MTSEVETARCALEGCDVPIIQSPGGGRPRLYCSDTHRSEARRRRLGGVPSPVTVNSDDPLEQARQLLTAALGSLQDSPRLPSYDAVLADARAAATAEVLRAQQLAADAVRAFRVIEAQLGEERTAWNAARQVLEEESHLATERMMAIEGSLEGAKAALEAELLAHHEHAEGLEAQLAAERALHESSTSTLETDLGECRDLLAHARAMAESAQRRAHDSLDELSALHEERDVLVGQLMEARIQEHNARESVTAAGLRASTAEARADALDEALRRLTEVSWDSQISARRPAPRRSSAAPSTPVLSSRRRRAVRPPTR